MRYLGTGKIDSINFHKKLNNNLVMLYRSKYDLHLGVPDYLFYKMLRTSPKEYYEATGESHREYEVILEQEDFEKYENLGNDFRKEVERFVDYFHNKYVNTDVPIFSREKGRGYFTPVNFTYNSRLITQELLLFYKTSGRNK